MTSRHLIHDLNALDSNQFQEQTLLNVVHLAMKFIHSRELKSHLGDISTPLARIKDLEKRKLFTILVTMYLMSAGGNLKMDDILAILTNSDPKEEVMQTIADQIRAESRSIFVQEGELKGELKGIRSTILDLVLAKFDHIPLGFSQKLNSIEDIGTLKGLSVSLIKSETIEDFLARVDKATKPSMQ